MNCIQIQLQHSEVRDEFVKWFREQGFDSFMKSKQNNSSSDPVTCLTTDETIEHEDHYFELE